MINSKKINIKGIVIASEWDAHGHVSAVDIAGHDEKRYRIADNQRGQQLQQLVKQAVVVQGRVIQENRHTILHVDHFDLDTDEPVLWK